MKCACHLPRTVLPPCCRTTRAHATPLQPVATSTTLSLPIDLVIRSSADDDDDHLPVLFNGLVDHSYAVATQLHLAEPRKPRIIAVAQRVTIAALEAREGIEAHLSNGFERSIR